MTENDLTLKSNAGAIGNGDWEVDAVATPTRFEEYVVGDGTGQNLSDPSNVKDLSTQQQSSSNRSSMSSTTIQLTPDYIKKRRLSVPCLSRY